jgi:hypothetical protein
VARRLAFQYDREADILYIGNRPANPEQETEELGDDVVARTNPKTGAVESLEVLFFSTRCSGATRSSCRSLRNFAGPTDRSPRTNDDHERQRQVRDEGDRLGRSGKGGTATTPASAA